MKLVYQSRVRAQEELMGIVSVQVIAEELGKL